MQTQLQIVINTIYFSLLLLVVLSPNNKHIMFIAAYIYSGSITDCITSSLTRFCCLLARRFGVAIASPVVLADMNRVGCSISKFSSGSLSIMDFCWDAPAIDVKQGSGVISQVSFLAASNTVWALSTVVLSDWSTSIFVGSPSASFRWKKEPMSGSALTASASTLLSGISTSCEQPQALSFSVTSSTMTQSEPVGAVCGSLCCLDVSRLTWVEVDLLSDVCVDASLNLDASSLVAGSSTFAWL